MTKVLTVVKKLKKSVLIAKKQKSFLVTTVEQHNLFRRLIWALKLLLMSKKLFQKRKINLTLLSVQLINWFVV